MKGRSIALSTALAVVSPGAAVAGSPPGVRTSRAPVVVKVEDGGFHWSDAAIGAAAAGGVALALTGTSMFRRQLQREER
jgi:hypothetical protein